MILFLDFDGVLHPLERPNGTLTNLPRFEQVMRDYPAVEIVVSSAWREEHSLDVLRSFFAPDIANRIIGITSIFEFLDHSYVRQAEILAWLQGSDRENEEWVALDDSDWLFAPNNPNLILVDAETGFNAKAEQQLRDYIESNIRTPAQNITT
jgi:hypothetical protein